MQKMILMALVVVVLAGCKYEEGPFFSFRSAEKRITGTWVADQVRDEDGNDLTEDYEEVEWTLREGGVYQLEATEAGINFKFDGTWELDNNNTELDLTLEGTIIGIPFEDLEEFDILRLTNKELWLVDKDNTEFRLEKLD